MRQLAAFRLEASAAIGGGHLARCREIARALIGLGWDVWFFSKHPVSIAGLGNGAQTIILPAHISDQRDEAAWISGTIEKSECRCGLFIVDYYELGAKFAEGLRTQCSKIVTFDDAGDKPDWAEITIDPTPLSQIDRPLVVVDGPQLRLRGAWWAPLHPQFAELRENDLPNFPATVSRILISAGATDPTNATQRCLKALRDCQYSGSVDVALTSAAPHLVGIKAAALKVSFDCTVHVDKTDMASLMASADLVIGAAGTSTWERACLAKPSVMLLAAANQNRNGAAMAREAAAIVVQDSEAGTPAITEAIRLLLSDAEKRVSVGKASSQLTDGRGAYRLSIALDAPLDRLERSVRLRPALSADSADIFKWQTAPGARKYSRTTQPPEWIEHQNWISKKLSDPRCLLSIIDVDGHGAGVLRLDLTQRNEFEVSILISHEYQGAGVGLAALEAARRLVPNAALTAEILPDNGASMSVFRKAGYEASGTNLFICRPRSAA